MADTADFQTMYAMLKVHSANQAKEIEILKERLSTPPADAALADAIKLACNYYRQAGRVGTTSQTLAKQHEAAADKIIAEALRVRAVPEVSAAHIAAIDEINEELRMAAQELRDEGMPGAAHEVEKRLTTMTDLRAMLAASKAAEGCSNGT